MKILTISNLLLVILSILRVTPFVSSVENLVPVETIPGTGLLSGIFYQVGMKRFPEGWVTWTDQKTKDKKSNYVQIDRNPNNLPHYRLGQKWHKDIQWAFAPPSKATNGFYTLRNKQKPESLTTVSEKDGHYHYVTLRREKSLKDLDLWKPFAASIKDGLYTIHTNTFPEGFVTWTDEKYGNFSHFIQVSLNEDHTVKYMKGGEWYDDTLFRFIPNIEYTGSIYDIQVSKKKEDLAKYKICSRRAFVKDEVHENWESTSISQNITISHKVDNEIGLKFYSYLDLKPFTRVKGNISLSKLIPNHNFKFNGDFEMDSSTPGNLRKFNNHQHLLAMHSAIEIQPGTATLATIYYEKIEVEIPIVAKMTVKGEADRILGNYSGVRKSLLSDDVLYWPLQKLGFERDYSSWSSGVAYRVSGMIKGSFIVGFGVFSEHDGHVGMVESQPFGVVSIPISCSTGQTLSRILKKCVPLKTTNRGNRMYIG